MAAPATPALSSMFIEADGLGPRAAPAPSAQAVEKFDRLLGAQAAAPVDADLRLSAMNGVDQYVVPPATFSQRLIPEPLAHFSTQASTKLRAAIESPGVSLTPEDAERFPDLALFNDMAKDMREFMVAELEFRFVNKTVESTEKNVQTLFRQQG